MGELQTVNNGEIGGDKTLWLKRALLIISPRTAQGSRQMNLAAS
jgi:hypothetical protein